MPTARAPTPISSFERIEFRSAFPRSSLCRIRWQWCGWLLSGIGCFTSRKKTHFQHMNNSIWFYRFSFIPSTVSIWIVFAACRLDGNAMEMDSVIFRLLGIAQVPTMCLLALTPFKIKWQKCLWGVARILYRRNREERPAGPETNGSNVTLRILYANQLDALKHCYLRHAIQQPFKCFLLSFLRLPIWVLSRSSTFEGIR